MSSYRQLVPTKLPKLRTGRLTASYLSHSYCHTGKTYRPANCRPCPAFDLERLVAMFQRRHSDGTCESNQYFGGGFGHRSHVRCRHLKNPSNHCTWGAKRKRKKQQGVILFADGVVVKKKKKNENKMIDLLLLRMEAQRQQWW